MAGYLTSFISILLTSGLSLKDFLTNAKVCRQTISKCKLPKWKQARTSCRKCQKLSRLYQSQLHVVQVNRTHGKNLMASFLFDRLIPVKFFWKTLLCRTLLHFTNETNVQLIPYPCHRWCASFVLLTFSYAFTHQNANLPLHNGQVSWWPFLVVVKTMGHMWYLKAFP